MVKSIRTEIFNVNDSWASAMEKLAKAGERYRARGKLIGKILRNTKGLTVKFLCQFKNKDLEKFMKRLQTKNG